MSDDVHALIHLASGPSAARRDDRLREAPPPGPTRRLQLVAFLAVLAAASAAAPPVADVERPMFERIDTVILRVRDVDRAAAWYGEKLGLEAVWSDADQRLVVLRVARDHTLTLWELGAGETPAAAGSAVSYPILAVADAATTRERLVAFGVAATPLVEAQGLRYFGFFDPDGNRLEACESR